MPLTWVKTSAYTDLAETDTHRYMIAHRSFDGALLRIYEFDDDAPFGINLVHTREYSSFAGAKRHAEAYAEAYAEAFDTGSRG